MCEIEDSNIPTYQSVVPLSQRRFILREIHDAKTSTHLGVTKTLNKIRQSYYWPGLQSDVRSYVSGCDVCARRKGPLKIIIITRYLYSSLPNIIRGSLKKYVDFCRNYFIERHIVTEFGRHNLTIKFYHFDIKFQIYSNIFKNCLRFKTAKMGSRSTSKVYNSYRMPNIMSKVISL
jgi:hypothetical protein